MAKGGRQTAKRESAPSLSPLCRLPPHVIKFCEDSARIAKPHAEDKYGPVVGLPVVSVKIGDHCYHGKQKISYAHEDLSWLPPYLGRDRLRLLAHVYEYVASVQTTKNPGRHEK